MQDQRLMSQNHVFTSDPPVSDRMNGIFELGAVLLPPPLPVFAGLLAIMIEEVEPELFEVSFFQAARPEFFRWSLSREMTVAELQQEGFIPLKDTGTLH